MLEASISMAYYSLNLPLHHVTKINLSASRFSTSTVKAKPSSVVLRTDGTGGSSSDPKNSEFVSVQPSADMMDAPVINLSNTVGVIGGVSASSTLIFLEKLVKWSSTNEEESIPFIVCNDPVLSRQLSFHERSYLPQLNPKNIKSQLDPGLVIENLRRKRLFLERSGARCIVMPCNVSHSWYNEISEGCSVPFLHIADCVAMELKAANFKPVETGSNLRIGVLATDATLSAGFYQEKLQNQGFEVVLPDKATMEHTVVPAIEAYYRKDIEGARNLLRIALQVLLVRAVNTIILAPDDMRGLLPRDDPLLNKCIDPMDALVRFTIQWANTRS